MSRKSRRLGTSASAGDPVGILDRIITFQVQRPLIPLLVAALLAAIGVVLALRLTVHTGFESLLPENRPSVRELDRVARRTTGVSSIYVVLEAGEGTPREALRKAGDATVAALERLGPPWVG